MTEYNNIAKRHRVEFDDGDVRWFRMERKIFTVEEQNGSRRKYHGAMQVRRPCPSEDITRIVAMGTSDVGDSGAAEQSSAVVAAAAIPPSPPPSPPSAGSEAVAAPPPESSSLVATSQVVSEASFPAAAPAAEQRSEPTEEQPNSLAILLTKLASDPPPSSSTKKPPKPKKVNKTAISRSHMYGTYTSTSEGVVLEGSWDEKKALVVDPSTRNPQKTFRYVVSKMATPVAPNEEDEVTQQPKKSMSDDEDDEEEGVIKNPNCTGGFYALAADGSGFEHFEDDMMLRTYDEPEGDDDEEEADNDKGAAAAAAAGEAGLESSSSKSGGSSSSSLKVKAVGWNNGGFFRIQGTATATSPGSTEMTLALTKEYISEENFDDEVVVFDRGLAGYDNDDGHIRVYYEGNTYLLPEVRAFAMSQTFLVLSSPLSFLWSCITLILFRA